jgi:hypothetical protein
VADATLIFDQKTLLSEGRFEVRITAYQVTKSKKFPDGVKLSCVLLDLQQKSPRLLLNNHEPYGYHLHTKMPYDKTHRVTVSVKNFEEAIEFFMGEVPKVVTDEI